MNDFFYQDIDSDGDGVADGYFASMDTDGDGISDTAMVFIDTNQDGIFDTQIVAQFADQEKFPYKREVRDNAINGSRMIEPLIFLLCVPDFISREISEFGIDAVNISADSHHVVTQPFGPGQFFHVFPALPRNHLETDLQILVDLQPVHQIAEPVSE